jgi:ribosomal protein L29
MSKQDHRIVTEKEIAEARQELFNLRFQNGLK